MAATSNPAPSPEGGMLLGLSSSVHLRQQQLPIDDGTHTTTTTTTNTTALPPLPQDVEHLQNELTEMRVAFQEYIATTQDLEVHIDKELKDMRKSKR
jgi:hypothetical protein